MENTEQSKDSKLNGGALVGCNAGLGTRKHNNGAPPGFIRKKRAAEILQVGSRTIDNWMKKGIIKHIKVGRQVYFRECELLKSWGVTGGEYSSMVEQRPYSPLKRAPDKGSVVGSSPTTPTNCTHKDNVKMPDTQTEYFWCRDCGAVCIPVAGWVTPRNKASVPNAGTERRTASQDADRDSGTGSAIGRPLR